jgi:SAM-dependent methyltransferase
MSKATEINIWELSDLRTPWCLFVVATLDIAEHIAGGKHTIAALAAAAVCDQNVLHAILGHLVSRGVFTEPSPSTFDLNDAARQLLDPITKASLDLDDIGGRFIRTWSTLLHLARTGRPAYDSLFGKPFWEDLAAHPELSASFDAMIGPPGHGVPNAEFAITGGWESIRTVVDVGGGTGAMLAEILRLRPHMNGILVDHPSTVERSRGIFQAAGVANRVKAIGQSFFDPLPPGADLYLLRGVINDWPDQEATRILSRCSQAARPAGRIVILKSVSPDDERRDITIEMLLLGGRHRTITEFRELAQNAGLEVISAGSQPSGYFVVECRPVM